MWLCEYILFVCVHFDRCLFTCRLVLNRFSQVSHFQVWVAVVSVFSNIAFSHVGGCRIPFLNIVFSRIADCHFHVSLCVIFGFQISYFHVSLTAISGFQISHLHVSLRVIFGFKDRNFTYRRVPHPVFIYLILTYRWVLYLTFKYHIFTCFNSTFSRVRVYDIGFSNIAFSPVDGCYVSSQREHFHLSMDIMFFLFFFFMYWIFTYRYVLIRLYFIYLFIYCVSRFRLLVGVVPDQKLPQL